MAGMKYRKLRIAWSVLCGFLCLLLIGLWERSYWWIDGVSGNRGRHYVYCDMHSGRASFARIVPTGQFPPDPWRAFSRPIHDSDLEAAANSSSGSHRLLGFQWKVFGNGWRAAVPFWFPTFLCGALAALPWLRWQFSLRTLLIGITVVAALLGLVARAVQ
jgi:hypothetical protein